MWRGGSKDPQLRLEFKPGLLPLRPGSLTVLGPAVGGVEGLRVAMTLPAWLLPSAIKPRAYSNLRAAFCFDDGL